MCVTNAEIPKQCLSGVTVCAQAGGETEQLLLTFKLRSAGLRQRYCCADKVADSGYALFREICIFQ